MQVNAWKELVKIPTYKLGGPDKNPMFLEKRVYQGSSGVVYPHAVIDKVYDEKEEKEWTALYLENEYLKVMILPELGGRIQMAYDKTNDYHFVYYNRVIKPALVGLTGPWISGGIEFNWPQHHRPSTFDATDFMIEAHADGSKTIWVNEYEIMFRTKCALGFTLYPGKAYIELHAKLYNRTPFPQSFLWWANPAVAVDEHYQSVFPPDVHAVFDHGKRDVSSFPVATGKYYKVDYSPGTDISVYSNIPVPTSYMAVNSAFNFMGGYHRKKQAGIMHIADHHISPGKKQWTWGCGEFGKAWDRQLTDEDGPYFELMCGVYTDNQPDFSWIMPNESREFKQYFMPYKNIGHVKNASVEAMVNLEINEDRAAVKVYVTRERKVTIRLLAGIVELLHEVAVLSPVKTFFKKVGLAANGTGAADYYIEVLDDSGNILVSYSPVTRQGEAIPDPAKPIPEAADITSNEELFLTGLHLEQYRHATYSPVNYYAEALRRDPADIRNNNALGLWHLRRGEYAKSEQYFRKAIEKLVRHNPNPYDGEPFYHLGLALTFQRRYDEAIDYLFKSTWNAAWQDNAYLQLAYIACIKNNRKDALDYIEKSIARNYNSLKARHLKALILRQCGRFEEAAAWIKDSLGMDHFDFGSRFEWHKILQALGKDKEAVEAFGELKVQMRGQSHSYIEISLDYANAGDYADAIELLSAIADNDIHPLTFYYIGYFEYRRNNALAAKFWYGKGFACSPDRVFPNRVEDADVLRIAVAVNDEDYKAFYYLGNYYYDKRLYNEAAACWEKSVAIYDKFPTAHRNLGIAYYNKFNKKAEAITSIERAFACDTADARILFELDQLYKRSHRMPEERLRFLKKHELLINERDDLYIEYAGLYSLTGRFEEADQLLQARNFHPWEGGEGKTAAEHVGICVELAKKVLRENKSLAALALLARAREYPQNLGEGKLYGAQENDIDYWTGCAYEKLSDFTSAERYWQKAAVGLSEPAPAIYYNDQQPDKIFYQGLALKKLRHNEEALTRFNRLIKYGKDNMNTEVKIDYFAVSLPDLMIFDDDLNLRNNIHCHYLQGLGFLGLEQYDKAKYHFDHALLLEPAHKGVIIHKALLEQIEKIQGAVK
jgi:tetratricopeptide (TPR) repeat protein